LKENKKATKRDPSREEQPDAHNEHAPPTAAESGVAKKNAARSAEKSENANRKPTPMNKSLRSRIWAFVKAQEHSNAVVAIFTGVITVTGIIYTIFAGLQWSVIGSQLDVMRKDQRAWIEASGVSAASGTGVTINIMAGQPASYPIKFINTGKTPARNIDASIFVNILNDAEDPPLANVESLVEHNGTTAYGVNKISAGIVFPNRDFGHSVIVLDEHGGPQNATEREVEALRNGTAYVAVYGIVTYDDVFKIHHWTRFCTWVALSGSPRALRCTQYNSVDSN